MSSAIALLICTIGVTALFYLDRDKSVRNSPALWLPVIWLWILGSRPVSSWLGMGGGTEGTLASTLDGSPLDAAVFGILVLAGAAVLFNRSNKTKALLRVCGPIGIYFLYCLAAVVWSPIPGPAFKRWTKAIGDLIMVLVVLTDNHPIDALRRLYSRVGFVLLPFSVALIRYTVLGRTFTPDGAPENAGVTLNKNTLGVIVYLVSLGALWNMRMLLSNKRSPNRKNRLLAQGTLLAFGVLLLQMAHSATSVTCFVLGGGLMYVTSMKSFRNRPSRVLALTSTVVVAGIVALLLGAGSAYSSALGRGEGLSGRTQIWEACIAAAGNPIIGTGFESFWNTNIEKVADGLRSFYGIHNLVSAHNGYLEVYLDLGGIGVALIAIILITGYQRASKGFKYDPELAGLMLAYIATGTFYSITEAGFRILSPSWIFLLLSVVCASGLATDVFQKGPMSAISGAPHRLSYQSARERAVNVAASV